MNRKRLTTRALGVMVHRTTLAIGLALLLLACVAILGWMSPKSRCYVSISFLAYSNTPVAGKTALFQMTNHTGSTFTWWSWWPREEQPPWWADQATNQDLPVVTNAPSPCAGRLKKHEAVTIGIPVSGETTTNLFSVQLVETSQPYWRSYVSQQLRRGGLHLLEGKKQAIGSPEAGR